MVFTCFRSSAQQDSSGANTAGVTKPVDPKSVQPFLTDSALQANRQRSISDSIASQYLVPDTSNLRANIMDSLKKPLTLADFFKSTPSTEKSKRGLTGNARQFRDEWVIAVIIGLLCYTGLLNLFFGADMRKVIASFYNKHSISQSDKEAGRINSGAFVGLTLLFCVATGLVIYLLSRYYGVTYPFSGLQLFVALSVAIGLMIALKFLLLKLVGFIFDAGGHVSEYIAVLNLTYFNLALMELVVLVCFGLLNSRFIHTLLLLTLVASGIIFVWQYLRNSLGVVSGFRFRKFYLFIYLCALEICPVLILIKALNI